MAPFITHAARLLKRLWKTAAANC